MFVLTPGTVATNFWMRSTRLCHSLFKAAGSARDQYSMAATIPIISSLPTFMGRHTAPSHGLLLARAASIRSFRPSRTPEHCGPDRPFPPLKQKRSTPIFA